MTPPQPIPLLSPRGCVLFPGDVARVELSAGSDLAALDAALAPPGSPESTPRLVAVVPAQRWDRPPGPLNVAEIGTAARVRSRVRLPGGGERVTFQGLYRVQVLETQQHGELLLARVERIAPTTSSAPGLEERRLLERTRELARQMAQLGSRRLRSGFDPTELPGLLELNPMDAEELVNFAAPLFDLTPREQAELLTPREAIQRLHRLHELVEADLAAAHDSRGLDDKVRERMRRHWLREQLETIRLELGENDPRDAEVQAFAAQIDGTPFPRAVRRRVERELGHLRTAARGSAEAGQIRNWLEWIFELPWKPSSETGGVDPEQFEFVRECLDESHTALKDVKDRVIEYLAVRQLRGRSHGTALCFVGPPGTGKSSMGRAVAKALGRRFVHVPIGGITEEAEIRGCSHRHEGGGPGLVMDGLHRAGSSDPVVLLDGIDEIEMGSTGTFGGALLEILDPARSDDFLDDYLGVPYDLSGCVFLSTANDLSELPEAVVDRLEVIEFSGYTESEKLAIAKEHLLPDVRERNGLDRGDLRISPAALRSVVRFYTEEAGVRQLGRLLSSLARKAAVSVVREEHGLYVRKGDLLDLLGPTVADEDLRLARPAIGVAAGLAWTSVGGALLPIEALAMPGAGRTQLTGQVGDVLRESVLTAISYVRTLFNELGLGHDELEKHDIHIHFPSAAVPKDGPSAGVPIAVAILSLITRTPVRHDVAMTGEVSLRGQVLPVGGMREKLLAALRAGIREVVVPARNEEEILRLPDEIRQNLTIHLIEHVRDAFGLALARKRGGRSPNLHSVRRNRAARRRAAE